MSDRKNLISDFEYAVRKADAEGWDFVDLTTEDGFEILDMLKEQEPRVLTFQEVDELAHKLEETPLYYERRRACGTLANPKTGEPLKEVWRGGLFGAIAGDAQGRTPNLSTIGNVTSQINEYGVTWRCWTAKPTDKQREATPWQD